jgi:transcriptional regulator with XRE-family HTH domain
MPPVDSGGFMLLELKLALVRKGVRQTRMAVELGWDPAKLSRIVNEVLEPTPEDRIAIANYLQLSEGELFQIDANREVAPVGMAEMKARTTNAIKRQRESSN